MQAILTFLALALATSVMAAPIAESKVAKGVAGKAFDRIAIIYLENTDYDMAIGDPNLAALAKKGITLTNYNGLTHPSQPNYIGSVAGETFGMDNDNEWNAPANVSTVFDLLDDKNISWAEYQEDIPSTGFTGNQVNPTNGANDYVRKHNPAMSFLSVTNSPERLAKIKSLKDFETDLSANALPQWMFITPNMTNDGHDTSVTVAGTWSTTFLTPLLTDKNFMQNTLVILTFDEVESYVTQNRVLGIALGDAVPADLVGTTDDNFYDHYSEISTVEANWDLHTLGRWDVGANVLSFVAAKTGDKLRTWSPSNFLSTSYPGLFNSIKTAPIPVPNADLAMNGRTVLPTIAKTFASQSASSYYTTSVEIPDGLHPPSSWLGAQPKPNFGSG